MQVRVFLRYANRRPLSGGICEHPSFLAQKKHRLSSPVAQQSSWGIGTLQITLSQSPPAAALSVSPIPHPRLYLFQSATVLIMDICRLPGIGSNKTRLLAVESFVQQPFRAFSRLLCEGILYSVELARGLASTATLATDIFDLSFHMLSVGQRVYARKLIKGGIDLPSLARSGGLLKIFVCIPCSPTATSDQLSMSSLLLALGPLFCPRD
ncbi:hypothetical protein B0H63DRAFT_517857 [Podospora didyma]|uniref:Uncharacterized protein n=1 Tax=Podospora didyma TaxID=330526 RepID=A0AAE0U8J6_9PEZI|nr:hypothetical protein B0H63DRAFT_517857 [Podospora didyma]